MPVRFSACVAMFYATISMASAASITSVLSGQGKDVISLEGRIESGDYQRLVSLILDAVGSKRGVEAVRLNSPGGELTEAIGMAAAVKAAKTTTVVVSGATCASACFVVFSAGDGKAVGQGAKIGVHGVSKDGRETDDAKTQTVNMARIVNDLGVPHGIVGKMVLTPPNQTVWLTPDDLQSMNVKITGGPSWQETWSRAAEISRQQNGADYLRRLCSQNTCANAVHYIDKEGFEIRVMFVEDGNSKVFRREVCRTDKQRNFRSCHNSDTLEKWRDQKTTDGSWKRVGGE
jgi:hypothetical protein